MEVTPDSEVVWQYISPVDRDGPMRQNDSLWQERNSVFRCYRYSPDYPAFRGRNMTPGDPIELPPTGLSEAGMVPPGRIALAARPSAVRLRGTIVLTMPAAAEAELAVFDSRGARVALLARGPLPAGESRFAWDAAAAPAGVYYVRIRSGRGVASARLTRIH